MSNDEKKTEAWNLDPVIKRPSYFERDPRSPLWQPRPSNRSMPEPMTFTASIAPDIVLDRGTLTLTALSAEADVEAHLRALGAKALAPGYVCGPRGELRPCERLRLPWTDIGLASDGSGVVVVDRPTGWTAQAVADVLGVSIRGRAPAVDLLGGDERREPAQRVVGEREAFTALCMSNSGCAPVRLDARVVKGAAELRWAMLFKPRNRTVSARWYADITSLLDPALWSFMPWLVHPLVVRDIAAWLREHTPPRETTKPTAWAPGTSFLDRPSDHRTGWMDEIRRHIATEAWPEVGVAVVPARVWLSRQYPARLGAALRSWTSACPTEPETRARLAAQLTLWSAAQEVDPGETAPDRTQRLAWTEAHLDGAPLPLLTELAAERVRGGAEPSDLDGVRQAIEAQWSVIASTDVDFRKSLPPLRTWAAPPALAKESATHEAAKVVAATFLVTDPLDFRLGHTSRGWSSTWSVPLPPALGADLLPWFDGETEPPEHAGNELVGLLNALAAGVIDPARPFVVMRHGDSVVEACWRRGAMWFRHAHWDEWTRDIEHIVVQQRRVRGTPELHPTLSVYLAPTSCSQAWREAVGRIEPSYPCHEYVARWAGDR